MERAGSDLTAFGETCFPGIHRHCAVWGKEDRVVASVSAVLPWDARP